MSYIRSNALIRKFHGRSIKKSCLQMKIGLFAAFFIVSANGFGASPDIAVISTSDGVTQIALTEFDRVIAESAGVARVIFSNGSSLSFSDPDLLTLRFVDSSDSGVAVPTCDRSLRLEEGAIVSEPGKIVEVFNASGVAVAKSSAGSISTRSFPLGVYIARQGVATLEFVVK